MENQKDFGDSTPNRADSENVDNNNQNNRHFFRDNREFKYIIVLENLVSENDIELFRNIHTRYLSELNKECDMTSLFDIYVEINSENVSTFFRDNNGAELYQVYMNCFLHRMKLYFHLLNPQSKKIFYLSFISYFYKNPSFSFFDKKIFEMLVYYEKLEGYVFFHDYGSNLFEVSNSILCAEIGDPNFMEANIFFVDDHIFLNYIIIDIFRRKIMYSSAHMLFENYVKNFYYIYHYTDFILLNSVYRILVDKLLVLQDSEIDDFYEEYKEVFYHILKSNRSSIFFNLWTILKIRVTIPHLSFTELVLLHIHLFYIYQSKFHPNFYYHTFRHIYIDNQHIFPDSQPSSNLDNKNNLSPRDSLNLLNTFTWSDLGPDESQDTFDQDSGKTRDPGLTRDPKAERDPGLTRDPKAERDPGLTRDPIQKKTLWIADKKREKFSKYFIKLIDSRYQINYCELSIFDLTALKRCIRSRISNAN